MLVSMNWIREFVNLDGYNLENLIRRFTLSTAEVEEIIYKGNDIDKVVVGEIISLKKLPGSQKLHFLRVNCGEDVYSCVCGAPNVVIGQKVAFAKAGGCVKIGKVNKSVIAGYESEGICCSERELGLSDDHSGLMNIDKYVPNGTDIKKVYQIDDIIFEVDNKSLTNRPDLWGYYGIAREFATLTSQQVKKYNIDIIDNTGDIPIDIQIKNPELVYRYSCIKIDGITEKKSPLDMRIRLFYCGMRAINLLTDLTNYIMLELGQPMHVFDGNFVKGIVVDTPNESITFTTLDGVERLIDDEMLMIYNINEPVAIAGVMGGRNSEIVIDTKSAILESANFDGISVRKTSSRLGLRTDASMRYEKILDPEITVTAIMRFLYLLKNIDCNVKVASKLTDIYIKKYPEINIEFDKEYVNRYTGIDIKNNDIITTLTLLGFDVSVKGNLFNAKVPSWRATKDVSIKADVIEEITRIYGYDNFDIATTCSKLRPVKITDAKKEENEIKDILVNKYNLNEVQSYIWCDGKKYKKLGIEIENNVRILNIATLDNAILRNSIIPNLLIFIYENRHFASSFGIFEVARIVSGLNENNNCNEIRKLGFALMDKTISEKELYFKAIDMIRVLVDNVKNYKVSFEKMDSLHNWQHPKNTAKILVEKKHIGFINTLHPTNLLKIDKNCFIVTAEIDMNMLSDIKKRKVLFEEPTKFPVIDYDLSLNIPDGLNYSELEKSWLKFGFAELSETKIIDIYDAGDIRSITIRFTFSSKERTLSTEEIQKIIDEIVFSLKNINVILRE